MRKEKLLTITVILFNALCSMLAVGISSFFIFFPTEGRVLESKAEMNDFEFIRLVSQKFSESHNYSREGYNCKNYSRDYSFVMEQLGYDASYKYGYYEDEQIGHQWIQLCMDISPQQGQPVDYTKEYDILCDKPYRLGCNDGYDVLENIDQTQRGGQNGIP